VIANEAELAARTKRLPDHFADRVRDTDLEGLQSMAGGGEWGELLDLLIAALRLTGATITAGERDLLRDLLTGWGLPTDQLNELVAGQ
jgi:hypothetical protein